MAAVHHVLGLADERKEKLRIAFEIPLTTRQVIFVTISILLDKFHLS